MENGNKDRAAVRMQNREYAERAKRNAQSYASFDKSDPFAYARAMAHYQTGVAEPDYHYEAEVTGEGIKNVKRP